MAPVFLRLVEVRWRGCMCLCVGRGEEGMEVLILSNDGYILNIDSSFSSQETLETLERERERVQVLLNNFNMSKG